MGLSDRSAKVIQKMRDIEELRNFDLDLLGDIPLGMLRKHATRLHAVCRYKRGVSKSGKTGPQDVRCIDLHPYSMTAEWSRYADFLLYHEYIHALGIPNHGREFRFLEGLWPDEGARLMGQEFGRHLRERSSKWLWVCPPCNDRHPRSKRGNGRYRCRSCEVILEDVRGSLISHINL